jgi:DNA topoisomerase-3
VAGCDYLFLWLDCDREGENICYEVIETCRSAGLFPCNDAVYRARFSSLAEAAIKASFARPARPNPAEAASVDARQELDLKIGVSLSVSHSFPGFRV